MKDKNKLHPYHYTSQKNKTQIIIDWGFPATLFLLFFAFYNFGKITPSEMVKTTGLLSISLLSITLLIGPLCRIFPQLDFLKAHRKLWGILSFVIAFTHVSLVYVYFYKFNVLKFFNFSHPKYSGILTGLLALAILFLVTFTSSKWALTKLSPKAWKIIQTTSYLALFLAFSHFYIMETVDGVLTIKRLLGKITFLFVGLVLLLRLLVLILPARK